MQTKFEHFAAASMLGAKDSPPRCNGELAFDDSWESRAFGMAIALSKKGHYEWEEFRQQLIASIATWEAAHALDDPNWNYYQRWLAALEHLALESALITPEELDQQTAAFAAETISHRSES
ncbi:MAG: nitrile hydratase accessory protein [Stenomitos frigidus ULC029]